MKTRLRQGFTLVEIVVVIVVVGVLAGIVVVSYFNMSQKAIEASMKSDLRNSNTLLDLYYGKYKKYPESFDGNNCPVSPSDPKFCLKVSQSTTSFTYISSPPYLSYILIARDGNLAYQVTESGVIVALQGVTVASAKNINTDTIDPSRTCADGVSYSVTALTVNTATLSSAPPADCLLAGDEIVLINLQGTSTNYGNVGNYEVLKIQSIASNTVTFQSSKSLSYGDGVGDDTNIGTSTSNQRVILQRVPNYSGGLTVDTGGSITANSWNGVKGGVVFIKSSGNINVKGAISVNAKGWRGGGSSFYFGGSGESFKGGPLTPSSSTVNANGGGGGGANSCNVYDGGTGGPGGAGYATNGVIGGLGRYGCQGTGGASYGVNTLSTIFFGSGGGGNATIDWADSNSGGNGGGIIVIIGSNISVSGSINANGGDAFLTPGYHQTSGGSGGSIYIKGTNVTLGSNLVTASSGASGDGANWNGSTIWSGHSGPSSVGRIAIYYNGSISGSTSPAAYQSTY